jgi:hypothetical protein
MATKILERPLSGSLATGGVALPLSEFRAKIESIFSDKASPVDDSRLRKALKDIRNR